MEYDGAVLARWTISAKNQKRQYNKIQKEITCSAANVIVQIELKRWTPVCVSIKNGIPYGSIIIIIIIVVVVDVNPIAKRIVRSGPADGSWPGARSVIIWWVILRWADIVVLSTRTAEDICLSNINKQFKFSYLR